MCSHPKGALHRMHVFLSVLLSFLLVFSQAPASSSAVAEETPSQDVGAVVPLGQASRDVSDALDAAPVGAEDHGGSQGDGPQAPTDDAPAVVEAAADEAQRADDTAPAAEPLVGEDGSDAQEEGAPGASLTAQASTVTVTSEDALKAAFTAGGEKTIDVGADIVLSSGHLLVPANADITLLSSQNHKLSRAQGNTALQMFFFAPNSKLTLGSGLTVDGGGQTVVNQANPSTFLLDGATIANGGTGVHNASVLVSGEGAYFEMRSGEIKDCDVTATAAVHITNKASAAISGGTISGCLVGGTGAGQSGTVAVTSGSSLTMTGGSIQGNDSRGGTWTRATPGVLVLGGSAFSMSGGSIERNGSLKSMAYNTAGAGVCATGSGTTFDFTGGSIQSNYATYGGGIAVLSGATLSMSKDATASGNRAYNGAGVYTRSSGAKAELTGGKVSGNYAYSFGGGVCASTGSHLLVDGVSIEGNEADSGGGVYVGGTNDVYLYSGSIRNNVAKPHGSFYEGWYGYGTGGGITVASNVNGTDQGITMRDVIVTDNHAGTIGGGAWLCPTGDMDAEISDGMAIYDNEADHAADDLAIVDTGRQHDKDILQARMLGGGLATRYVDGSVDQSADIDHGDGSGNRYRESTATDKPVLFDLSKWDGRSSVSLHNEPTDEAKELARQRAKLVIDGNKAENAGGGIASNGHVRVGRAESKSLVVKKVWGTTDGKPGADKVTVYLEIDGEDDGIARKVEEIVLSEANDWTHAFEGLPPKARVNLQEAEVAGEGWVAYYEELKEDEKKTADESETSYWGKETVTVTNAHAGKLSLTKRVVGLPSQKARAYTFRLTILNPQDNEPYETRDKNHHPTPMNFSWTSSSGTTGTLAGGTGTVSLTDGETVTVEGIPNGALYRIDEQGENEADYAVEVARADGKTGDEAREGTVVGDATQAVTFTNDFEHEPGVATIEATKTLEGRVLAAGEFTFELCDENGIVLDTKANDERGIVLFDQLHFGDVGTHTLYVREAASGEAGVTDDASTHKVTVTVSEVDGSLQTAVSYERDGKAVDALSFDNVVENAPTYKPMQVSLEATKTLEGAELEAGQFSFKLDDAHGETIQTKENDANGIVSFDALSFDHEGTYTFEVNEAGADLSGEDDDAGVHVVTVTVAAGADGVLEPTVAITRSGAVVDALSFDNKVENKTSYTPVKASLEAVKTLEGALLEAGQFTFHLDDAHGEVLQSKKNDENGIVLFDDLAFTEPGTYAYQVREDEANPVVSYDGAVHVVTFHVSDAGAGKLALKKTVELDGKEVDFLAFDNKLEDAPTYPELAFSLAATKTLKGRALQKGEFSFKLDDVHGKKASTHKNDAQGGVSLGGLSVTQEGTYVYEVSEVKGKDQSVTYDRTLYTASVRVKAGSDGRLAVESVTYAKDGSPVKKAVFANTAKGASATAKPGSRLARTGDETSILPIVALAAAGAGVLIAAIAVRRRRRQ